MSDESDKIMKASQLFLTHQNFVKGLAFRLAPLPGYVEDITQQVYLEFASRAAERDLDSDIRPLLRTITRNISLKLWSQRMKATPENLRKIAEHVREFTSRDPEPFEPDAEILSLQRCLEKLPEKSHQLVTMHYFDGVSMAEIARSSQVEEKTLRTAFCRLRDKLRVCIRRVLKGESPRA